MQIVVIEHLETTPRLGAIEVLYLELMLPRAPPGNVHPPKDPSMVSVNPVIHSKVSVAPLPASSAGVPAPSLSGFASPEGKPPNSSPSVRKHWSS